MALADDLQRAHGPDVRGLGGYSGSAYRRDGHRIQSDGWSSEWRAYTKGAAYLAPWIVALALILGLSIGPLQHGWRDHTDYRTQVAEEAQR